jgi:hypothetical protein
VAKIADKIMPMAGTPRSPAPHHPVLFNFHNYQEFNAENRFEGNVTTFTTTANF